MLDFKMLCLNLIEQYDFVEPQGFSWRSPYTSQNNFDYLKIEVVKLNPNISKDIVVPTICDI